MPVIVVKDEKDLGELRRRLLRPGVTAARRRDVEDRIRAANPHLDLDRLRPGAVVVLPDDPDLAEEAGEPAASLAPLTAALPQASQAVRRAAEATVQLGEELAKALGAREVRRAADGDAELGAEVARLREAIAAERRRAQEWSDAVAAATQGWERDLAELRRLSG
ncbi:MAG TPA: hypothetical protein VFB84_14380 [Micromonosporaceae bacterium]|nr:hypothetical protein [Micromonosporaceae bacterium]